jgi:hypothetical protein
MRTMTVQSSIEVLSAFARSSLFEHRIERGTTVEQLRRHHLRDTADLA